jgi:uncharacterized protein
MREDFRGAHPVFQLVILILLGFGAMFVLAVIAFIPFYLNGYGLEVLSNAKHLTTDDSLEVIMIKVMQIAQAIGLFIAPYAAYRYLVHDNTYHPFQLKHVGGISAIVFAAAMFSAFPMINFLAGWNASITFPIDSVNDWIHHTEKDAENLIRLFLETDSIGGLLFNLLIIALIPAIGEEMLFRGTFQPLMLKTFKGKYHFAIWVTAFWFSFLHLQFLGFFPRLLLGAVLGYAAHWSGSLLLPMIGHFMNNALAVLVAYFIGLDALDGSVETLGADQGQLSIALLSTLLLVAGMRLIYRRSRFKQATRSEVQA